MGAAFFLHRNNLMVHRPILYSTAAFQCSFLGHGQKIMDYLSQNKMYLVVGLPSVTSGRVSS